MALSYSPQLEELIRALQCLPGVGRKSAQRMAFHALSKDRQSATHLGGVLQRAMESIRHCTLCRMLTEEETCGLCRNPKRDSSVMCVVESPADVLALEESNGFSGRYFVLMGHLSPIDGVGPTELGLDLLERRLADEDIREIIVATNVTVEGDATAHLIAEIGRRHGIVASRIAHGVPMGGELEFLDSGTLARALSGRRQLAIEGY